MDKNEQLVGTLGAASQYCEAGFLVVPIPPKRKGPALHNWQTLRLTAAELGKHFGEKQQNLGVLFSWLGPGVYEVGIPRVPEQGTASGYFDDPAEIVLAVRRFDGQVEAIYIRLNPCDPDLMAWAATFADRGEIS